MKALFVLLLGAAISSASVGAALHGAEEWQAIVCLVVGGALMFYSLFMLVRAS